MFQTTAKKVTFFEVLEDGSKVKYSEGWFFTNGQVLVTDEAMGDVIFEYLDNAINFLADCSMESSVKATVDHFVEALFTQEDLEKVAAANNTELMLSTNKTSKAFWIGNSNWLYLNKPWYVQHKLVSAFPRK